MYPAPPAPTASRSINDGREVWDRPNRVRAKPKAEKTSIDRYAEGKERVISDE